MLAHLTVLGDALLLAVEQLEGIEKIRGRDRRGRDRLEDLGLLALEFEDAVGGVVRFGRALGVQF